MNLQLNGVYMTFLTHDKVHDELCIIMQILEILIIAWHALIRLLLKIHRIKPNARLILCPSFESECGSLDLRATTSRSMLERIFPVKNVVCSYNISTLSENTTFLKIIPKKIEYAEVEVYSAKKNQLFEYELKKRNLSPDEEFEIAFNDCNPISSSFRPCLYILVLPLETSSVVELEYVEVDRSASTENEKNYNEIVVYAVVFVGAVLATFCGVVLIYVCYKVMCGRGEVEVEETEDFVRKKIEQDQRSVERIHQDSNAQQIYHNPNVRSQAYMIGRCYSIFSS
ncbi:unnamed protein product [Moneuplotes crassus]|uniref:Uncharacterized protein n=1 Tax=Euplotes crassus TaxID=5936 RepID=A0AAD1XE23_EUPCR|nr:unnamed protein product [Moneuplotes crassus]